MKILILATDYPNLKGGIASFFIHIRCKYYLKKGLDFEVLNFKTKEDYEIDNIKVISLNTFKKIKNKNYDLLILHAPNLRNHYFFLKKYGKYFKKYLFFCHGHEVLKLNKDYPKPYSYTKKRYSVLQNLYDWFKLKVWHYFFIKNNEKSSYIFVSNWIKEMFFKNTKIDMDILNNKCYITYNSIGEDFEKERYQIDSKKTYDFITIRGNLDGSKYCIDIVNQLAKINPSCKFLVIGKGKYFDYFEKSNNIVLMKKTCTHTEIIELLNQSKCALMPTRNDTQGLMACEMATFGIPLITSDIDVCHEIFDGFTNVEFINNDDIGKENLVEKYNNIMKKNNNIKNDKFFLEKNCDKEIKIIKNIIKY